MNFSDATCIRDVNLKALTIGPAALVALSSPRAALRVHSIFSSTVNLVVEGSAFLVALTGPRGAVYPQAVALGPDDLAVPLLAVGDQGHSVGSCLNLTTIGGSVTVDFGAAARPVRRDLTTITDFDRGGAFYACSRRLAEYQATASADLRIDLVMGPETTAGSALGDALCRSARALLSRARARGGRESLSRIVCALLGAGPGLTPAGDDFLCGFLAAARATRPSDGGGRRAMEIDGALCESIEESIALTGEISASLLRLAIRGYWPRPLADLLGGIAAGHRGVSLLALDELCALGHSSGSDIATGFLCGHYALISEGA